MSKRFTDSEKYKKPFLRGLKGPYKLLWDYLYHDCDNAGIWIVDFEVAQVYLGKDMPVNQAEALRVFNEGQYRVHQFHGGKKWFIPSFITFQYNELSETNPAHKRVISTLNGFGFLKENRVPIEDLESTLIVPSKGTKVMDKVMDGDRVMVKEAEKIEFEIPPTWDRNEFNRILDLWISARKKKKKSVSIELIKIRISELVQAVPVWAEAKKRMTEAAHEGWLKFIYPEMLNSQKSKPNGITEPSGIRDRA